MTDLPLSTVVVTRPRVLLINPNTSRGSTVQMLAAAEAVAAGRLELVPRTAEFGSSLITDEAGLAEAARAVLAMAAAEAAPPDGVIISAFGDPGLAALRKMLACPIVGIAEAAMAQAAEGGRRFSVATTTPALAADIRRCAEHYGFGPLLASVRLTKAEPVLLMADPSALLQALAIAVEQAWRDDGAEAVIIGGGPLAAAARDLALASPIPIIEPIPAAVQRIYQQLAC